VAWGDGLGDGIVAVTDGDPEAGVADSDRALTPAMPVAWLQAAVSSTAPVSAAQPVLRPDRMISTRVTVAEDNLYLCS